MAEAGRLNRFLPYVTIVAIIACCIVVWWCWWRVPPTTPTTTVILVRHAERAAEPSGDPVLTPAGDLRAQELVHVAGGTGAVAIYASQLQRTQLTVEPLATALGLSVTVVDASDTPGLVAQLLAAHRGEVVVVAGHSNTVPAILEELGAPSLCPDVFPLTSGQCFIPEGQYDNLFVASVGGSGTTATRLRYGAATP